MNRATRMAQTARMDTGFTAAGIAMAAPEATETARARAVAMVATAGMADQKGAAAGVVADRAGYSTMANCGWWCWR
jgi:hypothetical protein